MKVWCCAALCCALAVVLCVHAAIDTMRCQRRFYRTLVTQSDAEGRRCWDTIDIKSCRGRCDSREISDWQFPYKKSHHPVCVHGTRRPASVLLRNCDHGATPGTQIYHYMEAKNCKCQTCSSEDTSCEWLPPNSTELDSMFAGETLQQLDKYDEETD